MRTTAIDPRSDEWRFPEGNEDDISQQENWRQTEDEDRAAGRAALGWPEEDDDGEDDEYGRVRGGAA